MTTPSGAITPLTPKKSDNSSKETPLKKHTMKTSYKTHGTCSSHINIEVEDGIVTHVQFYGGCNGNLQGICRLVTGMKVDDVIARLEGIQCNHRPTSCPDQLCQALRSMGQ